MITNKYTVKINGDSSRRTCIIIVRKSIDNSLHSYYKEMYIYGQLAQDTPLGVQVAFLFHISKKRVIINSII
jgi:hypothetical protein